jgi:hypothetical protein
MDMAFIFIAGFISGLVGLGLGGIVGKGGAGLLLGLFLGPIGWIIVFLLPRDSEASPSTSGYSSTPTTSNSNRPERDLESDAYKIWLGKQYNITRNDLFEKFECNEKLFDSLLEALTYADDLEKQQEEKQESDCRESSAQVEQQTVGDKESEKDSDSTWTDTDLFVLIATVIAAGGGFLWLMSMLPS